MPDTELPARPAPANKLDIDWLKTVAGALAAVTTSVLLSTLGAAGTIIGAALGSIAATIGTALYSAGLARSKETVAKAQQVTLGKVGVAQAEVRRAGRRAGDDTAVEAHLHAADRRLQEAKTRLDATVAEPGPAPLSARLAELPWKRIGITAVALFIAVLVAITAFEVVTGRSVASRTGGGDGRTSIGSVTNDGGGKQEREAPRPSEAPTSTSTPSEEASPSAPATDEATPTPTPSPSATPSETVEEAPAPTPTAPPTESVPVAPAPAPLEVVPTP
ncbi:hypothetical protein [Nocardioides houyundeii]|uniref:hypothetical protein n=1 Tax=Nocardioides houyundeii TaxID=2045452 RepID=UPI0013156D98|nr:hypothetical protein [Nocardioides houyundeii]